MRKRCRAILPKAARPFANRLDEDTLHGLVGVPTLYEQLAAGRLQFWGRLLSKLSQEFHNDKETLVYDLPSGSTG